MNVMCESLGVSPASINQLDNLLYEHVKNIHDNNMLKDALTTSQEGKQSMFGWIHMNNSISFRL